MSDYLQLSLQVDLSEAQPVTDLMNDFGALSVTVQSASDEECYDSASPGEPRWRKQSLTALFEQNRDIDAFALQLMQTFNPVHPPRVSKVQGRDWERACLDQFNPIEVGDNLWVCPSWCDPPHPDQTNLMIDPGLAFGTGAHNTTRLCLSYLSRFPLAGKRVIDYGCGSGILGIAALKLGADNVTAVDVDPKAISTSKKNALVNGVASGFSALLADQFNAAPADVVLANILAGTLIELAPLLTTVTAENGTLILSGILDMQINQVCEIYRENFDFECHRSEKWVMLAGTKQ